MPSPTKKASTPKKAVASKGSGKKNTKSGSSKSEESSIVTESTTMTETSSVVTPMVEDESVEFTNQFQALSSIILNMASQFKEVQSQLKTLQKTHAKEVKALQKRTRKRKNRDGKAKSPSGFTQPTKISDQLAGFLGLDMGSEIPRTEVTKKINCYIKENNLQWEKNKRHIKPDKKLGGLLNVGKGEELTYFNLQTYLKPHYIKALKAVAT
jgi:chromatin remodeling complex protein RSC6